MNKKNIITILLALVAVAGQAKTFKTIKNPVAMACVNVSSGELKAREVIFRDTATTVHFTMKYSKGQSFQFVGSSYLMDEDGNRYPLRSAEGLKLNTWVQSPESGITEFTMHFEPLPKKMQIFDFIEGDGTRAFKLLGIHDKKAKLKVPTMQELTEANPWTVPEDWFKTDTITVKGRIEGYDAEQFGFTSLECFFQNVFEKDDATLVLDIAPDGTFYKTHWSRRWASVKYHSSPAPVRPSTSPCAKMLETGTSVSITTAAAATLPAGSAHVTRLPTSFSL